MLIIDIHSTPRQAFANGFLKGLGSPLMLYGVFRPPKLQQVNPLKTPERSDLDALAGDWLKVGLDLKSAISRYEQESASAKKPTTTQ